MRQLLIAFCLAAAGVCISAVPDGTSAAKPSSMQEAAVAPTGLRSQADQATPSGGSKGNSAEPSGAEPDVSSDAGDVSLSSDDAPASSDAGDASQPSASAPERSAASQSGPSRQEFCTLLMSAAKENTLPIGFFVNLIWQESRFVWDAVSSAGALGVAQFMPAVAERLGLRNPFDPRQALPASARLLRVLHDQFGNLGLAAAAYNAGPKRVVDWLAKRGRLPRETRNYVLTITGRAAEDWMTNPPPPIAFRVPPRVPCFQVDAFAAAVKPADSAPPRESASAVKPAETKAVKLSRSATKRTQQSARVRAAFKSARIQSVIAKRSGPTKSIKEAARTTKDAAKPTKEAARTSKDTAKPTKEAALRAPSKTNQR
jgi:hypothetical protein